MKISYFLLICVLLKACGSLEPRQQVITTSNLIIKKLFEHDSASVLNLFIYSNALSSTYADKTTFYNERNWNISKGFILCKRYPPPNISKYKIRIDSLNKTVYYYYVEIPFIEPSTKIDKGSIVFRFANYFGYDKAVDIHVTDYDAIENAYQKDTQK